MTNWQSTFRWGFGLGLFLVVENEIILLLKGASLNQEVFFNMEFMIFNLLISFSTAVSEEILYRGFLLNHLRFIFKSNIPLNFLVALLFAFGHLAISICSLGLSGS